MCEGFSCRYCSSSSLMDFFEVGGEYLWLQPYVEAAGCCRYSLLMYRSILCSVYTNTPELTGPIDEEQKQNDEDKLSQLADWVYHGLQFLSINTANTQIYTHICHVVLLNIEEPLRENEWNIWITLSRCSHSRLDVCIGDGEVHTEAIGEHSAELFYSTVHMHELNCINTMAGGALWLRLSQQQHQHSHD